MGDPVDRITREEFGRRVIVARNDGFEMACVYCGAGLTDGNGDHHPDCTRAQRPLPPGQPLWTLTVDAAVDGGLTVELWPPDEGDGTFMFGFEDALERYDVFLAPAAARRALRGLLAALQEASPE